MRKASSNWLGKSIMTLVMGVLIVSFGIWGIGDIFRGFGRSTLAKIGGTEISIEQFRQIYTDRLQQIGRQFGRPLTPDQARAIGLDRQVLQQVIAETSLDEEARKLGLNVSDAAVMRAIYSDPSFKGANGQFDPNRFAQVIRQFGYTEQRFLAEQRRIMLRRQIGSAVTAGINTPNAALDVLDRYRNEERTIAYLKLGAAQAGTIDAPSSEALAAYYDKHKALFRAPEYRKIAFAVLTPETAAKTITVSDEDARKAFEQQKARFTTPERREISQIVFPTIEDANAAREKLVSGTPFADIAKARGLSASDSDLGLVAKADMLDPAVADAAFALPVNEISQPIKGRFGYALVKVGRIEPGKEPDYNAVAGDIKRDIALQRAQKTVQDLHNKMEDERGGGASVAEAGKKLGLEVVTIDAVDRSGRGPDGKPVSSIPKGLNVVPQAFNSDIGVDNDAINFNGGYVWFDVLGITPSRERTLEEAKTQVEERWHESQVTDRLRAKATEMVAGLQKGAKLEDEAAGAGVSVQTATFKRAGGVKDLPDTAVNLAFRTDKDAYGQTEGDGGAEWIVLRVNDIKVPQLDVNSPDVKSIKETLQRNYTDEQVGEYIARIENEIGVSINNDAVAQITGANSN